MRVDPIKSLKKRPMDINAICQKAALILAFISVYIFFFKLLFF